MSYYIQISRYVYYLIPDFILKRVLIKGSIFCINYSMTRPCIVNKISIIACFISKEAKVRGIEVSN